MTVTLGELFQLAFFALGINKQLDLQTALTEIGRIFAEAGGWYEQRQSVQLYFIVGVAIFCALALLVLLCWARGSPFQTWFALVGSTFVLGYVLIRAASFHHIDRFINSRILELKWNWILEMGGIMIVLFGKRIAPRVAGTTEIIMSLALKKNSFPKISYRSH